MEKFEGNYSIFINFNIYLKNHLEYCFDIDNSNNKSHWALWCNTIQLQGINCTKCGEFIFVGVEIPEKSWCNC